MSESTNGYRRDEDGEDEEEIDETGFKAVKDAVLFAIEVSESMLATPSEIDAKKPDTGLTPVAAALKCAYTLMQQRIISNPKDMMGILLFGTVQSRYQDGDPKTGSAGLQYPHCYLLMDLDVPAANDVKLLRNIVDGEDEEDDKILQASEEQVSMANVLFCANQIFTTKAPNFSSRRLFLVTDNDLPHADSRDARNSAAVRAKDLYDLGVTIDLFPISHPDRGHSFDRSKFYDDIIYSAVPSDPEAPAPLVDEIQPANSSAQGGISLLQSLLTSVASKSFARSTVNSNLPFEIAPGLRISVNAYTIIKRQTPQRSCFVYLPSDSDTPRIATAKTAVIADDTARTVEHSEIRKAFRFGGETVYFTPEELANIKKFDEPVLRIIGFKPISMLPIWANFRPSTFIYPSEEGYVGSTRVFSALWQKLLRDKKMALAWYIGRKGTTPVIAAVIPGDRKFGKDGEQILSAGLWVKPLPFADDVRQINGSTYIKAPDHLIDAMRPIIQQLQLPKGVYNPSSTPNPSLQWFYKVLQAMALEEDEPEMPEDKTLPRYRQIAKRAGPYIVEWGEELGTAYQDWSKVNTSKHYPLPTGAVKRGPAGATTAKKKIKEEDDDGARTGPSESDLRTAFEKDAWAKYLVRDLKTFAQSKGLPSAGKKTDLINAITQYFETRMNVD